MLCPARPGRPQAYQSFGNALSGVCPACVGCCSRRDDIFSASVGCSEIFVAPQSHLHIAVIPQLAKGLRADREQSQAQMSGRAWLLCLGLCLAVSTASAATRTCVPGSAPPCICCRASAAIPDQTLTGDAWLQASKDSSNAVLQLISIDSRIPSVALTFLLLQILCSSRKSVAQLCRGQRGRILHQ